MMKIPKQEYSPEFRELAIKRVKAGQTVGAIAKELGLVEQSESDQDTQGVRSSGHPHSIGIILQHFQPFAIVMDMVVLAS